jgi:phosphatidylserine/phosphatidylglycerophosphate/cardiolipin synthase-like enzyme/DNA/RNA endonuclease YhcR with UshA esterase domain
MNAPNFRLTFQLLILLLLPSYGYTQTISISAARALPVGSIVTVNGTVTSGSEFGTIRYIQDGTGGIGLFSTSLTSLQRGDNVTVTGTTTQFQNLLEIVQVTAWNVNSSGNPLPAPLLITPTQLGENNESMLVRIPDVSFLTSGAFQGNTTYTFNSNGQTGVVYIRSSNPLVGRPIPTGTIELTGVNSQYGTQYQVLPRDSNDLVSTGALSITKQPYPQNITTTGFDISWETNAAANHFLRYGLSTALELGTLVGPSSTNQSTISISGGTASQLFYVQSVSVNGTDSCFSPIRPFITRSLSSGSIKPYFTRPVDNANGAIGNNYAVYLNDLADDTIKAYIDRTVSTLDIAIYSFDAPGGSLIAQAINDAYTRGVQVRLISDGGNTNNALQLLNPAIPVLQSPTTPPFYYGIMHNKFVAMDANHPNPLKPVVLSGSTNWTLGQLEDDRNNLVFIQDQSLAKVYTMEFEEMWGGSSAQPNPTLSKFGPDKSDNTPHVLNVGGKIVESYFSPSDNVNGQILRTLQSADHNICFATMVLTRTDLAYAIEDRALNHGVGVFGIMNDSSGGSGTAFQIIQNAIGSNMLLFDFAANPGIMHHKYALVDYTYLNSDPIVLTGSHNWSSAATQRNDENTLVIHDHDIVNQYFQEFLHMYNGNGGSLGVIESSTISGFNLFPNPTNNTFSLSIASNEVMAVPVVIRDMTGKVVHMQTLQLHVGLNELILDVSLVKAGMYLVQVGNGRGQRLVVY